MSFYAASVSRLMRNCVLSLALAGASAVPLAAQDQVSQGSGAVIRALDKVTGVVSDLELPNGTAVNYGRIIISVEDCRFPSGNPAGNAYAHVTVWPNGGEGPALFNGWMVAGSPALNALDHPRYDAWVLRCITS